MLELDQVQDDDATVGLVVFWLRGPARRRVAVDRDFQARLVAVALTPLALFLFALPNLLDDERR
jgi:hypothetical protein